MADEETGFFDLKPMKMLTTEQANEDVEFLLESNWMLQQKMDGTRAFIKIKYDEISESWDITWLSSNGSPLKHAAAKLHFYDVERSLIENFHLHGPLTVKKGETPVRRVVLEAVLDAELIIDTGALYVFDLPWLRIDVDGEERLAVTPGTRAETRLEELEETLNIRPNFGTVRSLYRWTGEGKREALQSLIEAGVEGAVFKHPNGPYAVEPKKRTRDQLKFKFVKDADVVVLERDRGGKTSAILGVINNAGVFREVGSCSMIGKPDAQPGDVIEVQYLYWTGAGMIQPRMTRIRHDKDAGECFLDQFPEYSREAVRPQG